MLNICKNGFNLRMDFTVNIYTMRENFLKYYTPQTDRYLNEKLKKRGKNKRHRDFKVNWIIKVGGND